MSEKIMFFGLCYLLLGVTIAFNVHAFRRETNAVKLALAGLFWPLIAGITLLRGMRWLIIRFIHDGKRLFPKRSVPSMPKHTTVQMLSDMPETFDHQPERWRQN